MVSASSIIFETKFEVPVANIWYINPSQTLNIDPTKVVYKATDIPSISWVTIGLIALGFDATSGSTPDKAIINPKTVPINPKIVNELAMSLI